MIVSCPNCLTHYQVPLGNSATRNTFRCTKCRHEWKDVGVASQPNIPKAPLGYVIVCPNCTVNYRVNQSDIPLIGRPVRCKKCLFVWHCLPNSAPSPASDFPAKAQPVARPNNNRALAASADLLATAYIDSQNSNRTRTTTIFGADSWQAPSGVSHLNFDTENLEDAPSLARPFHEETFAPSSYSGVIKLAGCLAALLAISGLAVNTLSHRPQARKANSALQASFGSLREPASSVPQTVAGIGLHDVTYDRKLVYGLGTMITVHGSLQNSANKELPLPKVIKVSLKNVDQKILYDTTFAPNIGTLGPHASIAFQTEIYDVPAGTTSLQLALGNER
jgi:predicted Zn finger-like uncharacterized protein